MSDIAVEGAESTTQTDPVSSFSFADAHAKAMSFGETANTPVDTPEHVEAVPEPVAAVEPSTNIDNASEAKLATLSDTDLVEVTVDGQPVQMAWKDAKGGVMRQAHYTKSMQQLRQEQSQFAEERTALQQDRENAEVLRNLLRSPELLQQFIQQQYPTLLQQAQNLQAAAEQADPNDIATVGQIQAAQAELLRQQQAAQEQFLSNIAAREEQLTRTIEDRQATAKLSADINTTVAGLFKEHPYIQKLIPNAEQVLRYEVLQLKPTTPEETVEAFKTVYGGWVENYKATVAETNKTQVLAKQKLVSNNIQPPGGTAPQPSPTNFKSINKMTGKPEVNWDALRAAALNYKK